jgi:small subunit ribosomal protein S18
VPKISNPPLWQQRMRERHASAAPKKCPLCTARVTYVDYKDVPLLRKFISDRGKIRAARVTGTCRRHQRDMATAIKNAREMALLPYNSVLVTAVK